MIRSAIAGLATLGLLSACASPGSGETLGPPDLSPIPAHPLTANGYLVIACVNQAIQNQAFEMLAEEDGDNRLIRFICDGGPALMTFNALGDRSAEIGSEWTEGDAIIRSTERVERNLYGVDFCRKQAETYRCEFSLNVGGFIKE